LTLSFLTPWAALVGLAVALPLAAFLRGERRTERVRAALGLPQPIGRRGRLVAPAVVVIAALLAAAAAQPVVDRGTVVRTRPAAEVFVVLDTSRSMLAASSPRAPDRFTRARQAARELRERLPEVPVGLASFTDRVLPHLFPTTDAEVFRATLERAMGVDKPPPSVRRATATSLEALTSLATLNYFAPEGGSRHLVLLSDFESAPFAPPRLGTVLQEARIVPVFLRFGNETERIFGEAADARYAPDPRAPDVAEALARASGGRAFGENRVREAAAAVRAAVESGASTRRVEERGTLELAPWLALGVVVPLAFVLRRRNLP